MRYIISPEELGAGSAFVQNLYSTNKPARKGAYIKLRTLISVLFPHIPISKVEFISVGTDKLGRGPVLIIDCNPSLTPSTGATALGDNNASESR